jgi:predicted PurR-regulated permease PerM
MRSISPWWLLVIAVIFLIYLARDVLGPFVIAGVVAYAFSQPVNMAQRRTGWPRVVIIGIGYVIALAIVAILVVLIAEEAISQGQGLVAAGPDAISNALRAIFGSAVLSIAGQQISVDQIAFAIKDQLANVTASPGDAIHLASMAGSFLLDTFLVLVVTFYLLLDGPNLVRRLVRRIPTDRRERTVEILSRVHMTMGRWLRGQLILIAFVALLVYVVLGPILNVPHALALGILTGVLEIIPLIGPIIATIIAGTVAFSSGGFTTALIVVVFYIVLRLVEDQVVVPVVIGRAVHLHPVVTIFAVLVGLSVAGILGGLLGVPVAAAVGVIFDEFFPTDDEPMDELPTEPQPADSDPAANAPVV